MSATFCGSQFSNIAVLQDYKFCNGVDGKGVASKQLHEVLQDGGDNIYVNSMMARQPFDFTGRTGTIVWDVDAKIFPRNDGHGWWTEMWISEDPGPLPYQQNFPSVDSVARNSFGLVFQGTSWWDGCNKANMMNGVTDVVVSNNYNMRDLMSSVDMFKAPYGCFKVADSKLNHFELHINKDTAELYASDAGVPSSLRIVFRVTGLNLNFTRGYISFQHTHYNARKSPVGSNQPGTTPSQTYRWDNIGFDGPVINALRGYDVPLNVRVADGASAFGYPLPASMSVSNVDLTGATKAYLNFNVFPTLDIAYSLNGNAWHTVKDPMGVTGNWRIRSLSIPVPLSELHSGVNSISIKNAGTVTKDLDNISNVDISIQH